MWLWCARKIRRPTVTFHAASSTGKPRPPAFFTPAPQESGRQCGWSRWRKAISKTCASRRVSMALCFCLGKDLPAAARSQFISVSIYRDGPVLASAMSLADGPRAVVSAHISEPLLWSPEEPNLYNLRIELHGPEGFLDGVDSYFGFRTITTQEGKVLLNGNPYYLKTVLDQGLLAAVEPHAAFRCRHAGRYPLDQGTWLQRNPEASEGGRSALPLLDGQDGSAP